jgi:hypothetical protein
MEVMNTAVLFFQDIANVELACRGSQLGYIEEMCLIALSCTILPDTA